MSKEEALTELQKNIDDPMISLNKKRQLFTLYQKVSKSPAVSPDVVSIINSLKRDNK